MSARPKRSKTRGARPAIGAGVLLLATLAPLCALAATVIVYNVRYSAARIAGSVAGAAPVLDGSSVGSAPRWVTPLLQDLSVISPALVLFTALCMATGAALLVRPSLWPQRFGSPRFPFPSAYRGHFVQLGLLGTIVGFVIAFSSADGRGAVGGAEPALLLDALGTALWSTLTALTLAYVVGPPVEAVYAALRRLRGVARVPGDSRGALDRLRERSLQASASLEALTHSASGLAGEMDAQRVRMRVAALQRVVEELGERLQLMEHAERESRKMTRDLEVRLEEAEARAVHLQEMDRRLVAAEHRSASHEKLLAAIRSASE
jgi:hypothetical protein